MREYFKHLFCIISMLIVGCQDFVRNEKVVGNYYLVAVDTKEDLTLSYKLEDGGFLGVVRKRILAIGNDDKYILAKQSSRSSQLAERYYIVPIYKQFTLWPEKGVMGPFTLEQFNKKRKELKISDNVMLNDK